MPPSVNRRLVLQAGLAACAVSALGVTLPAAAADEFDALRGRWLAMNTGGAIDPNDGAYADALARLSAEAQGHLEC